MWNGLCWKITGDKKRRSECQLRVAAGEADPQEIPRRASVWNVSDTVSKDSLEFKLTSKRPLAVSPIPLLLHRQCDLTAKIGFCHRGLLPQEAVSIPGRSMSFILTRSVGELFSPKPPLLLCHQNSKSDCKAVLNAALCLSQRLVPKPIGNRMDPSR